MDPSFEITRYDEGHRPGLVRLWTRFFGAWSADRLQRRWAWQFETNPFRGERPGERPVILLAVSAGEVVGHISGIPIPTLVLGREQPVLAASGLVVQKSHRWAGVALVRQLVAEAPVLATAMSEGATSLLSRCGVHVAPASRLRFTFPLRYAGELAVKVRARLSDSVGRLASPGVCRVAAPWYVPRGKQAPRRLPEPVAEVGAGMIRPIDRFDDRYDEMWKFASARFRWSVSKNARYMNWRYLDCPTAAPVCLGAFERSGDLSAAGVAIHRARTDRSGRPCLFTGEITELVSRDPASTATGHLLRSLMHAMNNKGIDSIGASYMHVAFHPLFERVGFVPADSIEFAAALGPTRHGHSAADWGDAGECYYTAGDGDGLYSAGF